MPFPAVACVWLASVAAVVCGSVVLAAPGAASPHATQEPPASPRPAGTATASETVTVRVPDVATSASDGLPAVLTSRTNRVSVPVWRAPGTSAATVSLVVQGRTCTRASVQPGQVARLRCDVQAVGRVLRVTVLADGAPLATWSHRVAGVTRP